MEGISIEPLEIGFMNDDFNKNIATAVYNVKGVELSHPFHIYRIHTKCIVGDIDGNYYLVLLN